MVDGQQQRHDDTQVHRGVVVVAPCPHCQGPTPIQLAQSEQVCAACGCAFQLDDYSTKSWQQKRVKLGKFDLLEEVGRGGFGKVYKARDSELDRIVAVKVPRGGQLSTADDEDRFVREARAAAQLHHPGIVPVYEVGRGADYPYIVSEFVHGVTLNDALTSRRFTIRETAELVAQIAAALDHAHRKGVVHRDLKPSNIMLERNEAHETLAGKTADTDHPSDSGRSSGGSRSGGSSRPRVSELNVRPRIMDFGLARRDDGEVTVTVEGQVLGTPAYMSPEQARGEGHTVERTSDVYSLGVILFELLTGELPFRGNKQMLIHQAIHDDAPSPRKLNNRIARDMETICLKCLRKEPGRRYGTARELADDLDRFLAYEPILARPVGRVERGLRWLRRHPAAIWSATLLLVLTVAGVAGERIWRQKQESDAAAEAAAAAQVEKVEYFVQLSRRRGELVGIGPTTEAEAYALPRAHRFISKGGVVQRVELVNGILYDDEREHLPNLLGLPRRYGDSHREATRTLSRDGEGGVVKEETLDAYGQLLWTLEFSTAEQAVFLDRRDAGSQDVNHFANRLVLSLGWDENGWLREIRFKDDAGEPCACGNGSWGVRLTHSQQGLVQRVENLDREGHTLKSPDTPSGWKCEYDREARLVKRSYLDERGQPAEFKNVHRAVVSYPGESCETSYFDLAGKPTGFASGYFLGVAIAISEHKVRTTYSEKGRRLVNELEHAPDDASVGKLTQRFLFNERGDIIELLNLDAAGRPWFDPNNGFARMRQSFDEAGNRREAVLEQLDHTGTWVTTKRVNSAHKVLEESHFSEDGRPKVDNAGVHRYVNEFDSRQNQISASFFGLDGTPVVRVPGGYHRWSAKFDGHNRQFEARFFGPDNRPVLSKDGGSHFWQRKHDDAGNILEESHHGVNDEPVNCKFGFAKWTKSYDARGNLLEHSEWMVNPRGQFVLKSRKDGKENELESAGYTADGEPTVLRPEWGFHRIRNEFDSLGRCISSRFYDTDGNPTKGTLGDYGWTKKYDSAGREVEFCYIDHHGLPMNSSAGIAKSTLRYSESGELAEVCEFLLTENGELALRVRKNGSGQVLEEFLFSSTGERLATDGIHRVVIRRDERGNAVEVSYYDVEQLPAIKTSIGLHRWVDVYDEHDRVVEGRMYGTDGKPINASWGGAKWTQTYDDQGNLVARREWIVDKHGTFLHLRTKDGNNRITEQAILSGGKRDDFTTVTYRLCQYEYDKNGRRIEMRVFDSEGRPSLSINGAHRITTAYDEAGRVMEENRYDAKGKPVVAKAPFARVQHSYDGEGKLIESKGFVVDTKGELVLALRTNAAGKVFEQAHFDEKGNRTTTELGYHRVTYSYDADGKVTDEQWFAEDGSPLPVKK